MVTTLWADDFNRANSTTVPGSPVTGGPYTVVNGTWGINGNALYTSASTSASKITVPGAADFDATFGISVVASGSFGLVFRYTDASNYWLLYAASGVLNFYRYVAAVGTAYPVGTTVPPDTIRLIVIGRRFYVHKNGTYIAEAEDGGFNATATTMGWYSSTNTTGRLDSVSVTTVDPSDDPANDTLTGAVLGDSEFQIQTTLETANAEVYLGRDTAAADQLAGV